jgi:hypothetical protein
MASNVVVSPNIVRAWFDTVLNPIIRGLLSEAAALAERNLTWGLRPDRLATFVPVREHLVPAVWPNFEQFLSLHSECNRPIEEHDDRLEVLTQACRRLEAALVGSPALKETFHRVEAALPAGRTISDYFGAADPEDYLQIISAHIINDVQKLPSYNLVAPFWNKHRDEFMAVRETPEVKPLWTATLQAADRFGQAVIALLNHLKTLRNQLSLSAGVPIVDHTPAGL